SSSTVAKKASRSRCATITLRRLRIEEAGELLALPLREVKVERAAGRLEVLRPPRAHDDGGDERIREQPREREGRSVDAAGAGLECLGQPGAVDVARPDRPHLALADQLLEGLETALDRRVRVRLVCQVHVDPLDAEPGEAAVELPADPFRREAAVFTRVHRVVDLRGELDRLADLRAFRAEPVADVGLAPP